MLRSTLSPVRMFSSTGPSLTSFALIRPSEVMVFFIQACADSHIVMWCGRPSMMARRLVVAKAPVNTGLS